MALVVIHPRSSPQLSPYARYLRGTGTGPDPRVGPLFILEIILNILFSKKKLNV